MLSATTAELFLSKEFSLGGKFKHLLSSRLTEPVFQVCVCTPVHIQAQIQIMLTCAHIATRTHTRDVCCVYLPLHVFLGSCVHPTYLCDIFSLYFVYASHPQFLIIYIDTHTHTYTHIHTHRHMHTRGSAFQQRIEWFFPPGAPSQISGKC